MRRTLSMTDVGSTINLIAACARKKGAVAIILSKIRLILSFFRFQANAGLHFEPF